MMNEDIWENFGMPLMRQHLEQIETWMH